MTSSTLMYCPSKKGLKHSTTLLKQSSFTCGPCFRNMFYWTYLIGSGYERILSPKWLLNNYTDGKRCKILWVSRVTLLSSRTKCTYHFISYKERKHYWQSETFIRSMFCVTDILKGAAFLPQDLTYKWPLTS